MRILVCGDSYSVTDPDFPGLHWSEKILNFSNVILLFFKSKINLEINFLS